MGPLRLKWVHKRLQERGIPLKSVQIQFSLLSPEPNKSTEIKMIINKLVNNDNNMKTAEIIKKVLKDIR